MSELTQIMLLTVNISQFTNRKQSKKATKQVEAANQARRAGNFAKYLLPPEPLNAINRKAVEIREYAKSRTLPWGDNGDRIIPIGQDGFYIERFMSRLGQLQREFEEQVEEFITDYPDHIEEARVNLGSLFNAREYPSVQELRGKFGVRISTQLLANPNDYRFNITSERIIKKLRESAQMEMETRHERAIRDMYDRVKDVIDRIKVAAKSGKGGRKRAFRNSLFDAIGEIVEVFPFLNYTGDAEIARMTEDMKDLIKDPETLRNNSTEMAKYVARAKQIEEEYFGL